MADKHKIESLGDFEWDILNMKGSLSQLLFSDGIINRPNITHLNLNPSSSPKMLCFGNPKQNTNQTHSPETTRNRTTSKKSSPSENHNTQSKGPKPKVRDQVCPTTPAIASGKPSKKMKAENSPPTSSGHAKVKRQGLGERIAALQQLVSPYGKTDTASVLHEAMGYIRFLHDQVQVLCSPYLDEVLPSAMDGGENRAARKNLRSRGLCLVPAACTLHVANSNGADFWSPAMVVGLNSDFFTSSDIH